MLSIRAKLSLGFGGLLVIITIIGVQSIMQLTPLGHSIDVILRENFRSVIACQQMKESLERMDSGTLFILLGDSAQGKELIIGNDPIFEKALRAERNNLTLPGEAERVAHIEDFFAQYRSIVDSILEPALEHEPKREIYFTKLLPLFQEIKRSADEILHMNQQNMIDANTHALDAAKAAKQRMYLLLFCGALIAIGFILFIGRWILRPINRLIRSADEIRQGNLDLVVQSDSRDEIGRLSEAFNEMAASLREFRRSDLTRIARIQRSTEQVFKNLPDAVAIVDLEGRVEMVTEAAADFFGLRVGVHIRSLTFDWIGSLFDAAMRSSLVIESQDNRQPIIQRFVKGEEHFFRPEAVPILDGGKQPTGVILILKDITRQLQQDELKRGVIATVSHQLKTPLTSLRMAVYLLLEEKAGPLTPKQMELLITARDDSDRLHSILSNLLDISRIESGRSRMDFQALSPKTLIGEQVEAFQSLAKDAGITLSMDAPDDLAEVWADPGRIGHVLANLLSNAIKYTSPGGRITVSAMDEDEAIRFSVSDTGKGIPAQYLHRIFDQFFRIPGQEETSGEGLGLAIAKEIIEIHGGNLLAASQEGKGSEFSFRLERADRIARKG